MRVVVDMRRGLLISITLALAVAGSALAALPRAHVSVRTTSLGPVLVDSRGHTLYAFDLDQGTKSTCTGVCAANWFPFLTTAKPLTAGGVPAAKIGLAKRANGKWQVMFSGHLLYFFSGDRAAGQVRGASIAHWAALSKAGARVTPQAGGTGTTPAPTPTTTDPYGGGGGYGSGGGY
jgi:predicted lipoprotein with Yx(FWY)xxD motif